MAFFTGSTSDGSDMRQKFGFFTNPNNQDESSSEPYNEEQRVFVREDNRQYRLKMSIVYCMKETKLSLDDVRDLVVSKKSNLSKRQREYVLSHYDSEGNFLEDNDED